MKKEFIYHAFILIISLHLWSCNKDSDSSITQGEITSFSVWDQKEVKHVLFVDNVNNTIRNKQTIPDYVNLSRLIAEFEVNSKDVVLKVNGKTQQNGSTTNDFSGECVYDLYLSGEKQRSYTVKITKQEVIKDFRTFIFPEARMKPYQPTVNVETGEITNENAIPSNIDITSLQPEFSTVEKNVTVRVNGIVQQSGVAKHDFSKPVVYTIEGEDGTSKQFTVLLQKSDEAYQENPLVVGSYADPTVIRMGNMFYLYVTSGIVRGYRSTDLINWERINPSASSSNVFTERPHFTADDKNDSGLGMWAPDINYFDGRYVMYYSISKWSGGATCGIGVGVSNKPEGPFQSPSTGNSNGKLFVSSEIGVHNSIDPCFVEEDGKRYLFWGSFNGIYMTELTADGMKVKNLNEKKKIAGNSFEAAYIHKRGNYYYLFASIGACCEGMTSSYKVVVGRADRLEGPYLSKYGMDMINFNAWNPTNYQPVILQGDVTTFGGPGHNSRIITDDNGVDWMLYHSYYINDTKSERNLLLDRVEWDNEGWPFIGYGTPSHSMKLVPVFK